MRKVLWIGFIFLLITTPLGISAWGVQSAQSAQADPVARSVILLIGDGMGVNQVALAEQYAEIMGGRELAFGAFPYQAMTTTHSASSDTTDSAAGASAMNTGYKVRNRAINVLPDGAAAHTVAQAARDAGKAVGVVSTARLTHATPAAVYAHVEDRGEEIAIADQLAAFAPEVALGGGRRYFMPQSEKGSQREDDRDLLAEMQAAGYVYLDSPDDFAGIDFNATGKLLGLFSVSHMDYELDRLRDPGDEPSLADMTAAALAVLDHHENGFYLMVEGARIDHASTAHDPAGLIGEVQAFDAAIRVALDYQAAHPDTLVIVTADHETGGLIFLSDQVMDVNALAAIQCSLEDLDDDIDDAFDDDDLDEVFDDIGDCGITLSSDEAAQIAAFDPDAENQVVYGDDEFNLVHALLAGHLSALAGVGWTEWDHTGQPIRTYAVGPGAELFTGEIDNTDINRLIVTLTGLALEEPED